MAQTFNPAVQDVPGERFLLIQLNARETRAYGMPDRYRHLEARVVRKAVPDLPPTLTTPSRYCDGVNPTGYLWAEYSAANTKGLRVSGLKLSGQITVGDIDKPPYCTEIAFSGEFNLTAMERHGHTARALIRHREKTGYVEDTFEARVKQLADALGIRRFMFYKQSIDFGSLHKSEFEVVNYSEMVKRLPALIMQAHKNI